MEGKGNTWLPLRCSQFDSRDQFPKIDWQGTKLGELHQIINLKKDGLMHLLLLLSLLFFTCRSSKKTYLNGSSRPQQKHIMCYNVAVENFSLADNLPNRLSFPIICHPVGSSQDTGVLGKTNRTAIYIQGLPSCNLQSQTLINHHYPSTQAMQPQTTQIGTDSQRVGS